MRLGPVLRKIAFVFRQKQYASDLDDEVRLHLDLLAREYRDRSQDAPSAVYVARRKFGNSRLVQQESRDMWGGVWLETFIQDVRYAFRQFRKAPGFTAVVIATLALGIGVNTAIFSIINGVVLRPLPYPDSDRLVQIRDLLRTGERYSFAYPNFLDCRKDVHSLAGMAAYQHRPGNLTAPGEAAYVQTMRISAGFFAILGVRPAFGREFLAEEDTPGKEPVAILSHSAWLKRFGNNSGAIGSSITLDGQSFTVVGVLPSGFHFSGEQDVYTPIGQFDDVQMRDRQMHPGIEVVGRLAQGVAMPQVNAELNMVGSRLAAQYPATNGNHTYDALSLKRAVVGDVGNTLYLLAGAVGLVLLIACANVANLFLARSIGRDRELAIRGAIGASRGRILRQILTESTLLGMAGGLAGFAIAALGTRVALTHLPGNIPRVEEITPDLRVLFFTLLVAVITGVVFGLAPALRSRSSLETSLRQGARGPARGLRRIQGGFAIAEVGLAVVLLAGAGLMIRTMSQLWSVSPGFDSRNLMVMGVALSPKVVGDPAAMRLAWQRIFERVQAVPGVESVSVSDPIPLTGDESTLQYWTSASPPPPDKQVTALLYLPSPDYLRTMKIPLLRGRFFTERDKIGSESVVVIDQNLAERAFPGRDPVGARLNLQILGPVRVVGVVGHVKHFSLDEEAKSSTGELYVPFAQIPDEFMKITGAGLELLVRTAANPKSVFPAVRDGVLGPGRDQPVRSIQTMEQIVGDSLGRRRLMLTLLGAFAGVALVLAAIGIYGVLSYSTSQRIPEIGIRLALGARPQQVLQLILRQGLLMAGIGLALGTVASIPLTRLLSGLIYGVRPSDPVTFGGVIVLLAVVAFAATYIPARRAAGVDPMGALRHD